MSYDADEKDFVIYQDKYIEGFVSDAEHFNGIVFLLREPNSTDKAANVFWFKEIVRDQAGYHERIKNSTPKGEISRSKRQATKYKNRFHEILRQLNLDQSLDDVVYCNIHPERGINRVGEEYRNLVKDADKKVVNVILEKCKAEHLIIFTCRDIYRKLKETWLDSDDVKIIEDTENGGLQYKIHSQSPDKPEIRTLSKLSCTIGNRAFTIYEIYHPSYAVTLES